MAHMVIRGGDPALSVKMRDLSSCQALSNHPTPYTSAACQCDLTCSYFRRARALEGAGVRVGGVPLLGSSPRLV
jgi:hypothetical protein